MNNYLFIFRQDTTAALVFESAPIPGGRITPSGVRYYATDHLGSTVAVVGNHSASRILDNASYSVYGEETGMPVIVFTGEPARYRFSGKESQEKEFSVPYTDFGARHYSPSLHRWLTPDPLSEDFTQISVYSYCAGDPVNNVDEDGRYIVAMDEESMNAIINMLTDEEASYISFENGLLNNSLLSNYTGESELMRELLILSSSDTGYFISVGSGDYSGVEFFEVGSKIDRPDDFYYGVTLLPGALNNPSPDSNVHIISAGFLNSQKLVANVAHELLGHAYFYELSNNDSSICPNHTFDHVIEEYFDAEFGMYLYKSLYKKNNSKLESHIERVVSIAKYNYENYH